MSSRTRSRRGSPPHTRGIQIKSWVRQRMKGFTPAYAGNTAAGADVCRAYQVHPRIRGEYDGNAELNLISAGSPPHTRGIPALCDAESPHAGFTPAYAGNTGNSRDRGEPVWVHPRIRGEYRIFACISLMPMGSPPHTRGIPGFDLEALTNTGFTPAYAGNTRYSSTRQSSSRVHPRIRGEYSYLYDH